MLLYPWPNTPLQTLANKNMWVNIFICQKKLPHEAIPMDTYTPTTADDKMLADVMINMAYY